MPRYWMISDRNTDGKRLGPHRGPLTWWICDQGPIDRLSSWREVKAERFSKLLADTADKFPLKPNDENEAQKHVTIFVHGFNNDWEDAARRYADISGRIFDGEQGLGVCVLFTWPSDGMKAAYLPDRADARESSADLVEVLSLLYDWLLKKQSLPPNDPKSCRAKTSIIAHSMGNYLLQHAMQRIWTRKNKPLLVSLINQLLMVAADVDNDLFASGEEVDGSDGDAIANLTYRVTALYSGRDTVLGLSAGLKHFGKRRLGRSGLAPRDSLPDNVWDVDCSSLFSRDQSDIHSAYFEAPKTIGLMREVLQGVDRGILASRYRVG